MLKIRDCPGDSGTVGAYLKRFARSSDSYIDLHVSMIVCAHIVEMLFQYFHNFIRIEGHTLHKVLINQYNIVQCSLYSWRLYMSEESAWYVHV